MTTLSAPMMVSSPMLMPGRTIAPAPIQTFWTLLAPRRQPLAYPYRIGLASTCRRTYSASSSFVRVVMCSPAAT